MSAVKNYEDFINEGVGFYTLLDAIEDNAEDPSAEEDLFSDFFSEVGASSADEVYLVGSNFDMKNEFNKFKPKKTVSVVGSDVWGGNSNSAIVKIGTYKDTPAITISDGEGSWLYVGPNGKNLQQFNKFYSVRK